MGLQTINLRKEQKERLKELRKNNDFNFSKFIRDKLDEYLKMIEGVSEEDGEKKFD